MSLRSRIRSTLLTLFRKESLTRDLDAELDHFLEQLIHRNIDRGMSEGEAVRSARIELGGVETTRQLVRDSRVGIRLDGLLQDFRLALRVLLHNRGHTVVTILTLALGIGATTAIYSVADGILFSPLPYSDSARLVSLFEQSGPSNRWPLSAVDYLAIAERGDSIEDLSGLVRSRAVLGTGLGPERIRVGRVTAGWFATFGIRPAEGRTFRPGEDRPGAELVAVVSHSFAERHTGGTAPIVGRTLLLDGIAHTVVGVLPPGLDSMAGWEAEVWPVLQLDTPQRRGPFSILGVARLREGVTLNAARTDLSAVSEAIFPIWADSFQDSEARLAAVPLRETVVGGGIQEALLLLLGSVAFLLLIALVNVTNLSLARSASRGREMALRMSLGASRLRLGRQLVVESALLALLGGVVGAVVAFAGLGLLLDLAPPLPRMAEIAVDGRVLLVTAALIAGCALVMGLVPAALAGPVDLARRLQKGGHSGTAERRLTAVRGALVTAEFALVLPVIAGAVLLLTSLVRMRQTDPGFQPDGLLVGRVSLPSTRYPDAASVRAFWDRVLDEVAGIAGVEAAGIGTGAPPDEPGMTNNFDLLDRPVPGGTTQPSVPWLFVSDGYYRALGVDLLHGRFPDHTDGPDSPPVVAVSASWAERFYPDEPVLGRQLYSGGDTSSPVTVVGVVSDVKYGGLAGVDQSTVYQSYTQVPWRSVFLLVRSGNRTVTAADIRSGLARLDRDVPFSEVETMPQRLVDSVGRPRFWAILLAVFAGAGVALAAVGVFGVLSWSVGQRTREIGIHMAMGARTGSVLQMVLRGGLGLAGFGVCFGLLGAAFLTRLLDSYLFGISAGDPLVFAAVTLLLLTVALLACLVPAHRASRVDPMEALRWE